MKIKKVMAMLLAATMIMGSTITTFAATSATITVNELNESVTYKYLQVVEPDTTSSLGWKFVDGYADEFVTAFKVDTAEEALQALIELQGDNNAATGTLHTSTELAAALTALTDEVGKDGNQGEGNEITANEAGLYVIVATPNDEKYTYAPMMAYVGDDGKGSLIDATVTAKGSHNVIGKELSGDNEEENESVSAGDIVEYEATVTYPFYPADAVKTEFEVTDTLTNGTFVGDSVIINVEGEDIVPLCTIEDYADKDVLSIDFGAHYNSEFAGKKIVITYKATVGEGEGDVQNKIITNLDADGSYVVLDKVSVKVKKTANDEPLKGAEFKIYEAVTEATEGYEKVENASVVTENGAAVETQTLYLKQVDTTRVTEGDDASVTFVGLDSDKTYYVKETDAPGGYTLNPNYYLVSGSEKDTEKSQGETYVFTDFDEITVDDTQISALPSTGGIGTTIFTIGGCAIMITAAGLFFVSRRKVNK